MRILATVLFVVPLFAQAPADAPRPPRPMHTPTNLKLLEPANLMKTMNGFKAALGVECFHCHVQGNFASDEKPQKEMARKMILMSRDINSKFPAGNMKVTCYTCHRGAVEPLTAAPAGAATATPAMPAATPAPPTPPPPAQ